MREMWGQGSLVWTLSWEEDPTTTTPTTITPITTTPITITTTFSSVSVITT